MRRLGRSAKQAVAQLKIRGTIDLKIDSRRIVLRRYTTLFLLLYTIAGVFGGLDVATWPWMFMTMATGTLGIAAIYSKLSRKALCRDFMEGFKDLRHTFADSLASDYKDGVREFYLEYGGLFEIVRRRIADQKLLLEPRKERWNDLFSGAQGGRSRALIFTQWNLQLHQAPITSSSIDADLIRRTLRVMITSRTLESKLSSLYKAGKIVGGVYLGTGQEAFSASLGCCLDQEKDIFAPLIRDQAGRTGFGEPLIEATRTYLGSALGPMRGRDGNIHRGRPAERRPAMISHLGTSVSVVAGMLMARRMKGELRGGGWCDLCWRWGDFHRSLS